VSATDDVLELFGQFGGSGYDEQVTMTEHCVQTAALASHEGAAPALVAASLLHDVGHLLLAEQRGNENFLADDWDHETVGADWIQPRFGDVVAAPVRQHVAAKRFLCATDPAYFSVLSPASIASLEVQGGPFTEAEVAEYSQQPGADDGVRLRRWDDDGKVAGLTIPDLADFGPLLRSLEVD
jgi:gamma-butyrobetaine dioxygenase